MWYISFEIGFFTYLNFLQLVVCINSSFRFIAEKYSRLQMYHSLLNHLPLEGHLDAFQLEAIKDNTAVNIRG